MSIFLRLAVVFFILFSVFTVYISTPEEGQFVRSADEGYYFLYAKTIKDMGLAAFPAMLERHLNDKTAQLYPHPSRIGYELITAYWFKLFPNTFRSLARLSFLCFVIFLVFSFYYCRKFFGSDLAYFYTMLLSCNPLTMATGRRVLQDSGLNLFWALSFWLFLDFLINRKNRVFIMFLLVYSVSIMIKEASVALIVFFVFAYLLNKYAYRQKVSNNYLLAICTLPFLLVGGIYYGIFGLPNIIALFKFILGVHFIKEATNPYSLFCMGPWYKYIIDFLMITPVTTLLSIGYLGHSLSARRWELKRAYFISYLLIVFAMFSSMKYTKIVRFVTSLDIAVSLFAVLALYEFFRQKDKRTHAYLVFFSLVAIFFINYFNFENLFLKWNIYDPISYWLLTAKQLVPLRQ